MNWYKKAQINKEPFQFNSNEGIHTIKLGPASLMYQVFPNNTASLSSLRVPQKYRNQGYAKKILSEFIKWLDKEQLNSSLGASPLDKKTNPNKLENLYEEFGYKPTGKRINPLGDKEMFREPNELV